jgi:hypothetical protein
MMINGVPWPFARWEEVRVICVMISTAIPWYWGAVDTSPADGRRSMASTAPQCTSQGPSMQALIMHPCVCAVCVCVCVRCVCGACAVCV